MTSTSTSNPTVAFFGATGGCTAAALALSLKAGYTCTALARTPPKLIDLLVVKDVPPDVITTNLSVTKGDVRDVEDVKKTLMQNGRLVDIIIFGIGSYPKPVFSITTPFPNADPTICAEALRTISTALTKLSTSFVKASPHQPLLCIISTTGVTTGPRDVPILLTPLYHWLLAPAHVDKRETENLVVKAAEEKKIRGFVIIRPSLLLDGPAKGTASVRVGQEGTPAVGYTIRRDDVGAWIYEKVVKGNGDGYVGERVSLTY